MSQQAAQQILAVAAVVAEQVALALAVAVLSFCVTQILMQ
jgi:hypothetical protein